MHKPQASPKALINPCTTWSSPQWLCVAKSVGSYFVENAIEPSTLGERKRLVTNVINLMCKKIVYKN